MWRSDAANHDVWNPLGFGGPEQVEIACPLRGDPVMAIHPARSKLTRHSYRALHTGAATRMRAGESFGQLSRFDSPVSSPPDPPPYLAGKKKLGPALKRADAERGGKIAASLLPMRRLAVSRFHRNSRLAAISLGIA